MSSQDARYHLDRTRRKFTLVHVASLLVSSLAVTFLVLCILLITPAKGFWFPVIAVGAGLIFFVLRAIQLKLFKLTNAGVASYLNRHYPALEEAADLILKEDEELTSLQQLQKSRSVKQLSSIYPSIKVPVRIGRDLLLFSMSILCYVLINSFATTTSQHKVNQTSEERIVNANRPASVKKIDIQIAPPAYTKLATRKTNNLNLRIPEGSVVQWTISFEGEVVDPQLIFSGNDSLHLTAEANNHFNVQRTATSSSFYNISWRSKNGSLKSSEFYQMEVIKDQPPSIKVNNLNQFTEFSLSDKLTVGLHPTLTDDYSVEDAHIIATVSKGSGESIKFRELKMTFDKPSVIQGPLVNPSLAIDILKLGLEPGDELYFYIEALDNKRPNANRSRTETFFVSLKDTSSVSTSVDAGLGVDLMPEYFRSQRQIIIDSEKLLKDKKTISKESFNSKSNSLAYDQKVLRLRYGEFLGEEFESGIGPQATVEDDHSEEKDVTEKYGHVHDKDNEHNLVEEKKSVAKPTHDHGDEDDSDPLKEFTHSHDSQEEATFFTQSIRAKLKAAITIMWDAELHLRLYDPQKSLPYQYRALKLLKEISQDSRIYVHRTGFEPPPLKEEKRLSGDLTEIKNPMSVNERIRKENYPDIRRAVNQIEYLLASDTVILTQEARTIFEKAGRELASVAIQQPGRYLTTLTSLKALSQDELDSSQVRGTLIDVRKTLWNLLPVETAAPHTSRGTAHKLDKEFLENLELLKRE
jgi:hypothetical protein